MAVKTAKAESRVDMLNGPLLGKIIVYTLPIIFSGFLQLAYNAADIIVVGKFAENSTHALAAVGSTTALMNLFVNICMGLSAGANVVVARFYGAGDKNEVSRAVHTSFATGIIAGFVIGTIGFILTPNLLEMLECPPEILGDASMYMRICLAGMTFQMTYNFVSGIVRAAGDTKNPFIILVVSGLLNIVLNLVTVICFHLGVAGVAIATTCANLLSAVLITILLLRSDDCIKLHFGKIRLHKDIILQICRIGIPSSIQGVTFSLSNTLLQSAINAKGPIVMAAGTASSNIENFVYISMNSFYHTTLAFVGQNHAAKKFDRAKKTVFICLALVTLSGVTFGGLVNIFSETLFGFFIKADANFAATVAEGTRRLLVIAGPYFLCGWLDVLVGAIRGMGVSLVPMISSVVGVCGIRLIWIYLVYPYFDNTVWLYMCYPVSWFIVDILHCITFIYVMRKCVSADPTAKSPELSVTAGEN